MATKDIDESKHDAGAEAVLVEQQSQPAVVAQQVPKKKDQTVITIAILSGVVLFFVGIGLGYLLGHTTVGNDNDFRGGAMQFPGDGGGRRFYPNSGTNDSTDNNSGSSDSSTATPQTN